MKNLKKTKQNKTICYAFTAKYIVLDPTAWDRPGSAAPHPQVQPVSRLKMCSQGEHAQKTHRLHTYTYTYTAGHTSDGSN